MTPAKPRLLFVDDRSKRIHAALKKYSDEFDVTIAPNVPEALRLLSSRDWNVVSLDFDLDGNDFNSPDSKTCAMEIVRYIERTGWPQHKRKSQIIIHSSNSFGVELMYSTLFHILPGHVITRSPFVYEGEQ